LALQSKKIRIHVHLGERVFGVLAGDLGLDPVVSDLSAAVLSEQPPERAAEEPRKPGLAPALAPEILRPPVGLKRRLRLPGLGQCFLEPACASSPSAMSR
jgi:hypothetical protein